MSIGFERYSSAWSCRAGIYKGDGEIASFAGHPNRVNSKAALHLSGARIPLLARSIKHLIFGKFAPIALNAVYTLCKNAIDPKISEETVEEMLVKESFLSSPRQALLGF